MAVDSQVTRRILEEELEQAKLFGESYGWTVEQDPAQLKIVTKMRAHNGDLFIIETEFQSYKEWPPFFEFIDPETLERGTRRAYPMSTDSFFHSMPCICAPFNRKAYKYGQNNGPHGDWNFGNWMTSRANNFDWSHVTTITDMLSMIQNRISLPELYKGRMR